MKKITLLLIAISFFGCSNDDNCQSKIDAINAKYNEQVQHVKEHPTPIVIDPTTHETTYNQIDYTQIDLINEERALKLSSACK